MKTKQAQYVAHRLARSRNGQYFPERILFMQEAGRLVSTGALLVLFLFCFKIFMLGGAGNS